MYIYFPIIIILFFSIKWVKNNKTGPLLFAAAAAEARGGGRGPAAD